MTSEPVIGRQSLEAAARFAIAVLDAQVHSHGREWDPKLAYTAIKYLEQNLPEDTAVDA